MLPRPPLSGVRSPMVSLSPPAVPPRPLPEDSLGLGTHGQHWQHPEEEEEDCDAMNLEEIAETYPGKEALAPFNPGPNIDELLPLWFLFQT